MLAEIRSASTIACLVIAVLTTQAFVNTTDESNDSMFEEDCELYLAPSGIPNTGFGVFTTTEIPKDSSIQPFSQGPTVVWNDLSAHQNHDGEYPEWIFNNYKWQLEVNKWRESDYPR